jgi:hypothetical protein
MFAPPPVYKNEMIKAREQQVSTLDGSCTRTNRSAHQPPSQKKEIRETLTYHAHASLLLGGITYCVANAALRSCISTCSISWREAVGRGSGPHCPSSPLPVCRPAVSRWCGEEGGGIAKYSRRGRNKSDESEWRVESARFRSRKNTKCRIDCKGAFLD